MIEVSETTTNEGRAAHLPHEPALALGTSGPDATGTSPRPHLAKRELWFGGHGARGRKVHEILVLRSIKKVL